MTLKFDQDLEDLITESLLETFNDYDFLTNWDSRTFLEVQLPEEPNSVLNCHQSLKESDLENHSETFNDITNKFNSDLFCYEILEESDLENLCETLDEISNDSDFTCYETLEDSDLENSCKH